MFPRTLSALFLSFLLFSLSFSTVLWVFSADGPVTTKPLLMSGNFVVGSQDGYLYSVNPTNGKVMWAKKIGGYVKQPVLFSDVVVAGSSNGHLVAYNKKGEEKFNIDLGAYVYGVASGTRIYATTNRGLLAIDKGGNIEILYNLSNVTMTAPTVNDKYIIFGAGKKLIAMKNEKQIEWVVNGPDFWKSNPVVDFGVIYIGALDNRFYSYDLSDGYPRWSFETRGWVMSTSSIEGELIYFGSNDGNVYALDSNSGDLKWKYQTKQAVQSTPALGTLGGTQVVFVGSNDNNLYAIDAESGQMIWKYPAKGWVHDPVIYGKSVVFGTHDGKISAISTERACTIDYPEPESIIGYREVLVKGSAFSEYGALQAFFRINEGEWQKLEVVDGKWTYVLDPNSLPFDLNTMDCKIRDAAGEDKLPYSGVTLVRSADATKGKFKVVFPSAVQEGKSFEIVVQDENGEPVLNFNAIFQDKTYSGSTGSVNLTGTKTGVSKLILQKSGFDDSEVTIDVKPAGEISIFLLGGFAVIGLIVVFVVVRKMRK